MIVLKKQQFERYKNALEQQRQKNADFQEQRIAKDRIETACDLQISIYKTLEESDILLEMLSKNRRRLSKDSDSEAVMDESKTVSIESAGEVKMGTAKKSKDDAAIIDEMHTLNHQLHILIYSLITRLDESSQESEGLREKIKSIEKEKIIQRVQPMSKIIDSVSKEDGKFATPDRELNRRCSITGEERKIILPDSSDLPPLELPEFDYSTFDEKL